MKPVKPSRLRAGDLIGLVSPASPIADPSRIDKGVRYLESLGYRVEIAPSVLKNHGYLAGTDEERAGDLHALFARKDVRAIITTGGTGLSSTDITIETVRGMLEKELPGFTALFMLLSYPQAKSASMLSRAMAGTIKGKLIFCLPGSPRACKLATEALIIPELGHMLMLLET